MLGGGQDREDEVEETLGSVDVAAADDGGGCLGASEEDGEGGDGRCI